MKKKIIFLLSLISYLLSLSPLFSLSFFDEAQNPSDLARLIVDEMSDEEALGQ